MGRSFLAHTLLTSQNNEENQNMRAEDMKDEEMALLLKKDDHDKKQAAQNQILDEVFNFRYLACFYKSYCYDLYGNCSLFCIGSSLIFFSRGGCYTDLQWIMVSCI